MVLLFLMKKCNTLLAQGPMMGYDTGVAKGDPMYLIEVYTPSEEGEEWVDNNLDIAGGWYADKRMFEFLCDGKYMDEFISKVEASGLNIKVCVKGLD